MAKNATPNKLPRATTNREPTTTESPSRSEKQQNPLNIPYRPKLIAMVSWLTGRVCENNGLHCMQKQL